MKQLLVRRAQVRKAFRGHGKNPTPIGWGLFVDMKNVMVPESDGEQKKADRYNAECEWLCASDPLVLRDEPGELVPIAKAILEACQTPGLGIEVSE